jgi:putative molybdopterin biosynthesis protein
MRERSFSLTVSSNSEWLVDSDVKVRRLSKGLELEPSYTVSLGLGSRRVVGELEACMLRAIDRTGSLSLAARTLGLSYPFVWNTISRIERAMNQKIVARERGGAKGGRAELTSHGESLLQTYSELDSRVQRFLLGDATTGGYFPQRERVRPDLSFIGSHCVVVEKILHSLHVSDPRMTYQMLNVGSWAGLAAIMLREADVAGVHILDESKSSYNESLLSRYGLSHRCSLVRGYNRQQCLMVRKGNPKRIRRIEDLLRRDVKLANRNVGSGTRMLLDWKLSELSRNRGAELDALTRKIRGYDSEMITHGQVADAVASRKADVGVGMTSVAVEIGLDFVPLADERYDFLVEKRMRNPHVREFFSTLASKDFQNRVKATTQGITFSRETGKVVS